MLLKSLPFWLMLFPAGLLMAQKQTTAEREQQIQNMPADTSKVNRWNELAADIQFTEPLRAADILQQAMTLSEKLNYRYGLSVAYLLRANLFFYEMKLDTAHQLLNMAHAKVSTEKDLKSRRQTALITQRYAGLYQQRQKYDSAVFYYQESAKRFNELNEPARAIFSFYNLSNLYNSLSDTVNALMYARETYSIARQSGDSTYLIRSLMALGDAYVGAGNYQRALAVSRQGLSMAKRGNQLFPVGKFHMLLGSCYDYRSLYDSSIVHYTAALNAFQPINLGYEVTLALYRIGHAYLKQKDLTHAIQYLEQSVKKAKEYKLEQLLAPALLDLVSTEEQLGNDSKSLRYLKEYITVNDSLIQRNNRQLVYDLEAKYQTEKKEAQIQLQQNQIRQKDLINYLLTGAVVSILLISFFMFYAYKQRRRLQEQRILELEQEKQLLASEAIIKGQEEERGRLAKDLHDGLGGILSGVKFSLTNMKSNVILDAGNALMFERSLDMLDQSIAELRRVAHNMMPEVLVRFGLVEALKSYCESVRDSGVFEISFQAIGMTERLDSGKEIILYRIVQELLNNAAKHAAATYVIVQVSRQNGEMILTVEDNGSGFDIASLEQAGGSGWTSIRSRVDYLKGKVDIQSAPGQGTSVQLIIPV